jgi:Flp pilus assembly protein TadG
MPLRASRMIEKKRGAVSVFTAVITALHELVKRRDGAVAMIFGLAAIPAVIAAGMAIDVGRAYMVKIRLGAALDAAALAIGSETNRTQAQLSTDLQSYFTANYPSSALGTNVTVTPVPANADLTASTLTFQAQATVPMTFMQLAGVNSINVTVTAQTKKAAGLEIALVLDNTGSMLCGANDGSDSVCAGGVVASDTSCTSSSNSSRICTLINAATAFVNTLTSAITSSQQLYIGIVPYVTNVNVGDSFCTGSTSCAHIAASGGNFTDLRGNMMPVTPITGNTTNGSSTISSISPSTSAIQAGMLIYGQGDTVGCNGQHGQQLLANHDLVEWDRDLHR